MYLYPQPARTTPRRPALGRLPTSAKRRVRRRFAGLGQVSAAPLVSAQQFCGSNCKNTAFINELTNAIQNRLLQWPPLAANAVCTGAPASSGAAKITQAASQSIGAASGITGALTSAGIIGGAATVAIPIVGAIAAPILLILGTIFSNHAKAVQLQTTVLCENIPAANAAFQQIDAGLANGSVTPAQALSAYAQIQSSFTAAMKSDPSYKTGDALWGYNQEIQAVIAQRTLDLQSLGSTSSSFLGTSLPSWLPWVAVGGLIYFLL